MVLACFILFLIAVCNELIRYKQKDGTYTTYLHQMMFRGSVLLLLGCFVNGIMNQAVVPQYDDSHAINLDDIHAINSFSNRTWTAGINDFFRNKTVRDVHHLCGTVLVHDDVDVTPRVSHTEGELRNVSVPLEFDVRTKWPQSIHPIRNQERCGSCWAFSAAEVLSDRFTIATKGATNVVLSPEDLVSCDTDNMGCRGGQLPTAWQYMKDTGIVSDACFPYTSGDGTSATCRHTCEDSEQFAKSKHKVAHYYKLRTVEDIQKDIMSRGPVQAAFRVYKSFMSYKSGVYQRSWWKFWDFMMGGHAVKIVGWGTTDTDPPVEYWTVANSWDTTWGEKGYFKIKRGVNMCGIEGNVYAGQPLLY
jgi:cathepsin B